MKRTILTALTLAFLLSGCAQSAPTGDASQPGANLPQSPAGPNVQVDWSQVEGQSPAPQPDLDGGRWYPEGTDHLIPREDYGPLIPYVGAIMYSEEHWVDNNGQEQDSVSPWPTSLYGLMTRSGKLVTDPVYLTAAQGSFTFQGQRNTLPVLILSQAREEWKDFCNGRRYAVAALDGSWVTDFEFWYCTTRTDEVLLCGPAGVTWIDAVSGAREDWSWERLGVTQQELPSLLDKVIWLYGFPWTDAGVYLGEKEAQEGADWDATPVRLFRPEEAEVRWVPRREWETQLDAWNSRYFGPDWSWQAEVQGTQVTVSRPGESHTLTLPQAVDSPSVEVQGDLCLLSTYTDSLRTWLFRLSDGQLLSEQPSIRLLRDYARGDVPPYILTQDSNGVYTFYSPGLEPLYTFSIPFPDSWFSCEVLDGVLTVGDERTFSACYDLDTGTCVFYRSLGLGD